MTPLLSMCLIARDEKRNIARCFDSWWEHVDEVVLVDTGSRDGTVAEAKRYAKRRGNPEKLKTARFDWCDDFAAARQAADDLATGQWLTWCDLDDTVQGLSVLRQLVAGASEEIRGYFLRYDYAQDPDGNSISELWRERVVRNDGTRWEGRLHEHKTFQHGTLVRVDPKNAQWVHHRDHRQRTGERNLRILEQWDADEPDNPRVLSSLALEYMGLERHRDASDTFARFLGCGGEPPDRRSQACRHMCVMLMLQGRVEDAKRAALEQLAEGWLWADTHLTLAEVEQTLGNPQAGVLHAQTALTIGKPDTLLIVNPLQYSAHPRAVMAVCLAQMGRLEEAVQTGEEALQFAPSYPLVADHLPRWRGALKRQHTLEAFLACVEVLVETGELLKAQRMLDQAPWFIGEEPRLIDRRSEIARMIEVRLLGDDVAAGDEAAEKFVKRHLAMA